MTQHQTYNLIYEVIKQQQLNRGVSKDKASRVANQYAVKATWYVFNSPSTQIKFIMLLFKD